MAPTPADRPTPEDLRGLLRGVIDPELGSDIVELGMVRSATIDEDGAVVVTIALTTSGCPLRAQIQRDIRTRVGSAPGVSSVKLEWTEMTPEQRAEAMGKARFNVSQRPEETTVGPTTRVVLAPDPAAPSGAQVPGIGWVPAISPPAEPDVLRPTGADRFPAGAS